VVKYLEKNEDVTVRDSWVEENPHLAARLAANPRIGQRFTSALDPSMAHTVRQHMSTAPKPVRAFRDRSEFFNDLRPGAHSLLQLA
jgi:hypothetical protein